jgi:hypothetical protein
MSMLDRAAANTDQADLVILSHVETIRDQMQPATASAVASLIGGAPVREIGSRIVRLARMGLVEPSPDVTWQLTEMGAELLRRELVGWSPSEREERRRWDELMEASLKRS